MRNPLRAKCKELYNELRCPVCGRRPRIRYNGYKTMNYWYTIVCHPMFRKKAHLRICQGGCTAIASLESAVNAWRAI